MGAPFQNRFLQWLRGLTLQTPTVFGYWKCRTYLRLKNSILKQAAIDTKLLGPNMVGLTLGHAVLVCPGYANDVSRLSTSFIMSNGMSKQNQFQHFFSCIFNNQQSELIIHRPDGRIRDKDSHGKNSFPPKG